MLRYLIQMVFGRCMKLLTVCPLFQRGKRSLQVTASLLGETLKTRLFSELVMHRCILFLKAKLLSE